LLTHPSTRFARAAAAVPIAAWLAWPALAGAQSSPVSVERQEPVVTRTEFDRLNPPAAMPALDANESGVCASTFEIEARVTYSVRTLARKKATVSATAIGAVTRLRLDIYTLGGGPPKLRAHEEAHRRISEYYYKNSTAVATELAEALIGKRFKGTGATRSLAQQNGFDQIVAAYNDAYMARTRARSAAANARFDEITDHGRKPIDEAEAFALAVASDPEP